jgi:uncharacterized membrane protein YqaE (UPF0057 family)
MKVVSDCWDVVGLGQVMVSVFLPFLCCWQQQAGRLTKACHTSLLLLLLHALLSFHINVLAECEIQDFSTPQLVMRNLCWRGKGEDFCRGDFFRRQLARETKSRKMALENLSTMRKGELCCGHLMATATSFLLEDYCPTQVLLP